MVEVLSPLKGVIDASEAMENESTNHEEQLRVLANFEKLSAEHKIETNLLECKVQLCPKLLIKGELFLINSALVNFFYMVMDDN